MNVIENILDEKHFNFFKELSEKTEAKRKYIKPLENLFSFFSGEKVKLTYKYDHQLFIIKNGNENYKRITYMTYKNENPYDLTIEFKKDYFRDGEHTIRIYIDFRETNICVENAELKFFQYLAKYGKDFELLLDGWNFNIIGERECI